MLSRLTVAFLLIPGLSLSINAQANNDLIGSYLFRFEWGGREITLKANGTFTSHTSRFRITEQSEVDKHCDLRVTRSLAAEREQ